jgi:predicted enzyme related to lactoylglutathione lyase
MAAMDTDFGRFAVLEDPWGAPFSVMQAPAR